MKNYVRFSVTTTPFLPDLISGVLWELPLEGISEEATHINLFAGEDVNIKREDIVTLLNKMQNENLIESFEVSEETFADRNWNEEWEKNIRPIEITDRIVIKPTFKNYDAKPGQMILEIDPKMSFGTGEHASTRLMLRLMEKYAHDKNFVLDVGSGTAVLSIAAAKMGCKKVIAIDNNEWCYDNGVENVKRNDCESKVEVRMGEIDDVNESNFDLILANINKHVLMTIDKQLSDKLQSNGILIMSGILIIDKDDILNKYNEHGLELIDSMEEEDWTGLVFRKTK